MGIRKVLKKGIFSGLSVKRWVGADNIKENAVVIKELATTVLKSDSNQKTTRKETFEESMQRLNLSEEDLQKRMQQSKKTILFYLAATIIVAIYLFFLIVHHRVIPSYVSAMLIFLFLAYAFREHFNLYQMKQRRLGCTLKEYFSSLFTGSK